LTQQKPVTSNSAKTEQIIGYQSLLIMAKEIQGAEGHEEISKKDYEGKQRAAAITPHKSVIDRFMKEAVEEDMTDTKIKFGINKLMDNHQKSLVIRAKAHKAASEAIDESLERTEDRPKEIRKQIDYGESR